MSQVDGSKKCFHQIWISSRSTEGACIILILLFVTRNLPLRALWRMSLSFLSANQFDTRSLSLSVSLSCRPLSLSLIAVPFPIPPWRDLSYFLSLFPSCGNPILNLGPLGRSPLVTCYNKHALSLRPPLHNHSRTEDGLSNSACSTFLTTTLTEIKLRLCMFRTSNIDNW